MNSKTAKLITDFAGILAAAKDEREAAGIERAMLVIALHLQSTTNDFNRADFIGAVTSLADEMAA